MAKKQEENGLFKEYTPSERIQMLEDNCDKIADNEQYLKKFTSEEIAEKKHELSEISIKLSDIDKRKKDFMVVLKSEQKPLIEEKSDILEAIRNKSQVVRGRVYTFLDHEDGVARTYDTAGDLIEERPLMPSERQKSILNFKDRSGTND